MADRLRPTVHQLIKQLAAEAGLGRPQLTVTEAAQNGESFSGSVLRVRVHDQRQPADDPAAANSPRCPRALRLVAKLPPTDARRRAAYNSGPHFAREKFVFERLLPAFERFQSAAVNRSTSLPFRPFDSYPTMVAAGDAVHDEFVLLDDLAADGFANAERTAPLAADRVRLVLTRLAHLHAVSFAFRHQDARAYAAVAAGLGEITFRRPVSAEMCAFLEPNVQFALDALGDRDEDADDRRLAARLRAFRPDFVDSMVRCCESGGAAGAVAAQEAVVLHGDCWISNLMFRKAEAADNDGDDADEDDVRFVDWQVARHGSVAIDLSHFLFCCTDAGGRADWPALLRCYHEALVRRIDELGSDGRQLFPFERLQWHMREYARFGLGMAIMTLHATTCPTAQMANVAESLDSGADLHAIAVRMAANPAYQRRIADVCRDAERFGYF